MRIGNKERNGTARTKLWELSDAVWERAQPLLPIKQPHKVERPRHSDCEMPGAIISVLRAGMR